MSLYFMCLILFSVGLYSVLAKKNIIKIIVGIGIMEYALNLFFILVGYRLGGHAPIYSPEFEVSAMVDPLPQALVLTAIVIGLAVTALLVGLAVRVYDRYRTFDISKIRRLRG